jgi:hypothetical protein
MGFSEDNLASGVHRQPQPQATVNPNPNRTVMLWDGGEMVVELMIRSKILMASNKNNPGQQQQEEEAEGVHGMPAPGSPSLGPTVGGPPASKSRCHMEPKCTPFHSIRRPIRATLTHANPRSTPR